MPTVTQEELSSKPRMVDLGSAYEFTWDYWQVTIRVEHPYIYRDGRLSAAISVTTTDPDYGPHLLDETVSLSSGKERLGLQKRLAAAYKKPNVPWGGMLHQTYFHTRRAYREGEPAVELLGGAGKAREVPKPTYLVEPFVYEGKPNMLFGPGGHAKTWLALLCAVAATLPYHAKALRLGELGLKPLANPTKTMWLDYENDQQEIHARLDALMRGFEKHGGEVPTVPLLYRRCYMPFADEFDGIIRECREKGVGFLVIDSISGAVGAADMNEAATATTLFNLLRRIGTTTLLVHHVQKNTERNQKTPFGSAFYTNRCRNIWQVRKDQEYDAHIDVGLTHYKSNLGPYHRPLGLRFLFEDDVTVVTRREPRQIAAIADSLPLKEQIRDLLLSSGAMTVAEVAGELERDSKVIRTTLERGEGKLFTRHKGEGADKWGVLYQE